MQQGMLVLSLLFAVSSIVSSHFRGGIIMVRPRPGGAPKEVGTFIIEIFLSLLHIIAQNVKLFLSVANKWYQQFFTTWNFISSYRILASSPGPFPAIEAGNGPGDKANQISCRILLLVHLVFSFVMPKLTLISLNGLYHATLVSSFGTNSKIIVTLNDCCILHCCTQIDLPSSICYDLKYC